MLKCDRCKEISEKSYFEIIQFFNGWWEGTQNYDLCSKCNNEFKELFKKFIK